jgi:hypothetical protein
MKAGLIGDLDIYLGTKLQQVELTNGVFAWTMSPSKYIQDDVCNVKEYLSKNGLQQLPTQCSAPWLHEYISELGQLLSVSDWRSPLDGRDQQSQHDNRSFQIGKSHGNAT